MIKTFVAYTLLFGCLMWASLPGLGAADDDRQPSLIVRFGSGKAYLKADDKARLRRFFNQYEVGPQSRIFIVGYTDTVGDRNHNYKLSRKRAQAIRREIISSFGFDAAVVMALGKGEENPVADNSRKSGRATNRRAEIYLANTGVRKPARVYGPGDPYLTRIETLVAEAQAQIRQRRLGEAAQSLKEARSLGGDHYSDWHATYGIAGFYAQAPAAEIRAHLATALNIDPYNYDARDYLSRITARENVARGKVTREMGLTADNAIPVSAVAQQYEYLRLFQVEPQAHQVLDGRPVDAWKCLTAQGTQVVYFFDHSRIYDWAFSKRAGVRPAPVPMGPGKAAAAAPKAKKALPLSKSDEQPPPSSPKQPKEIWESRIFK